MRALPKPAPVACKATLRARDVSVESREDPRAFVELVKLAAEFSVISPVHGGCPNWDASDELNQHVRRLDAVTPVRGSSLRGQLRFWWRATHGCTLGSLKEMRKEEDRLWGNASSPGLVQLRIDEATFDRTDRVVFESVLARKKDPAEPDKYNPRSVQGMENVTYGAFALQPKGNSPRQLPSGVLSQVSGSGVLVLSVPRESLSSVKDALIAWLLFGGIGGRTRRGFGAVHGKLLLPDAKSLPDISQFLSQFPATKTLDLVPSLHGARLALRAGGGSGKEALAGALGRMRAFRQGDHGRRDGNLPRPGRSRWPEPEVIRHLTGCRLPRHKPFPRTGDIFPRAHFGLPIVFHFKDGQDERFLRLPRDVRRDREPMDTTLQPSRYKRMSSPVILRPLKNGSSFLALCLVLSVPGTEEIMDSLVLGGKIIGDVNHMSAKVMPADAGHVTPLSGKDPLSAFLEFFKK
jgi:CRISPR-associated protein Cmr1